jgi:hypothetical protein
MTANRARLTRAMVEKRRRSKRASAPHTLLDEALAAARERANDKPPTLSGPLIELKRRAERTS